MLQSGLINFVFSLENLLLRQKVYWTQPCFSSVFCLGYLPDQLTSPQWTYVWPSNRWHGAQVVCLLSNFLSLQCYGINLRGKYILLWGDT